MPAVADGRAVATSGSVIVALGATAARSLLGRPTPIATSRDRCFEVAGRTTFVTYYPSAVLRADEAAGVICTALIDDLRAAAQHLRPS